MRKSKKQKMYRMRGCSKKRHIGGTTLAYTGDKLQFPSNPNLAYIGGNTIVPANVSPNQGPPILPTGTPIWNSGAHSQKGGCDCNMTGGKKMRSRKHRGGSKRVQKVQRGGFLVTDLVNVARYVPYTMGSVYNGLMGYAPPVNPMPTSQPALQNDNAQLFAKLARV